jgi:hypothetical protein
VPPAPSSPEVSILSSSRLTRSLLPLPLPQGSISSAETFSKNPNPGLTISNPIIEEDIGLIIALADAPNPPPPKNFTKGGPQDCGAVGHSGAVGSKSVGNN